MKRILFTDRPFQVKATIVLVLAMIFPLLLSNLFIYQFTYRSSFESLRNRLKLIAQLSAELVDAKLLAQIPLRHDGIQSEAFQITAAKLNKIKQINQQVRYVYILTKTDKKGIWQFVVDPEPTERKGTKTLTSYPGDKYNAGRFPEMLESFNHPAADKKLQVDEWGVTLSGYAPIYNARGEAIAVIGVDMMADDVYLLKKEVGSRSFFVFITGLFLCLWLGMITSNRITDPVEKLVAATRQVGEGNLNFQVAIKSNDEIGELASSFNTMAGSLKESRRRLVQYFYGIIRSLVRALEAKDPYTRGHSQTVARYSAKIAFKLGFSKETVKLFRRIALLHDIGKLGVSDETLNKTTPLNDQEWDAIRKHPLIGEKILRPILENEEMLTVIRQHHERYDGKGYPENLAKEKINIFSAIVAVADAYSAMTSDRSYRKALSKSEAMAELKRNKGTQFNPQVVEAFLDILEKENPSGQGF